MMLRWTSDVPPAIDAALLHSHCRCHLPSAGHVRRTAPQRCTPSPHSSIARVDSGCDMSVQCELDPARLRPGLDAPGRAARASASCAGAARAARRTTARARRRWPRRRARPARRASANSSSRNTSCTTCSLNGEDRARARATASCSRPTSPGAARRRAGPSGTNTSSRNTSLNSASPVICTSGRTSMPSASMSTTRYEIPACFGALGVGPGEADPPPRPLRVARPHLLPARAASRRRRVSRGSRARRGREPAPGSLKSWHQSSLASRIDRKPPPLLLVGAEREQRRARRC